MRKEISTVEDYFKKEREKKMYIYTLPTPKKKNPNEIFSYLT